MSVHKLDGIDFAKVYGRLVEKAEPIMQEVLRLDKLVDELAKGKAMDKILRD